MTGLSEEILSEMKEAVIRGDAKRAEELARQSLEMNIDPMKSIEQGLAAGVREVGQKFECGEAFIPNLFMAGNAMKAGMVVLEKAIPMANYKQFTRGKIVIATVAGDIHDLGKTLVSTMLNSNGFEVNDLGVDTPVSKILDAARDKKADIIALSSLMTITLPGQRDLIDELKRRGIRDHYKVLVGGGAASERWAAEIGADGYSSDAKGAVSKATKLVELIPH
jgi:corrinoid protein of di/trimethylamine methyltransferase